jgi:hypothetical protein
MSATVTSAFARMPALAAPVACGCCLAVGAAYVTAVDPSDGGGFLPCPFRSLTGWWCPGCGLTRATHHLFRGDVHQALRFNAMVVVVLAAIVAAWLGWLLGAAGRSIGALRRLTRLPVWVHVAAATVVVAFAVVRNLPGVDGLRG